MCARTLAKLPGNTSYKKTIDTFLTAQQEPPTNIVLRNAFEHWIFPSKKEKNHVPGPGAYMRSSIDACMWNGIDACMWSSMDASTWISRTECMWTSIRGYAWASIDRYLTQHESQSCHDWAKSDGLAKSRVVGGARLARVAHVIAHNLHMYIIYIYIYICY